MEIFKISHRHRLYKILFLAFACQISRLFSQSENALDETHPSPNSKIEPDFQANHYWQNPQDQFPFIYSDELPFSSPPNEWQNQQDPSPTNIFSSPVELPLDPQPLADISQFSTSKSFENENFVIFNLENSEMPNQEQYPLTKEEVITYPFENNSSAVLQTEPPNLLFPTVENDQTKQLPVTSPNEWQNQQNSPTTNVFSPSSEVLQDHQSPTDVPQFSTSKSFDKENFVVFDPDLAEDPDKEQHPLTKQGEATAYPFEGGEGPSNNSQLSPTTDLLSLPLQNSNDKTQNSQQSPLPLPENNSEPQQKELVHDLSQGKSNVKIVKKHSIHDHPSPHLEDPLQHVEEMIGKKIIDDSMVGLTENPKNEENLDPSDQLKEEFPQPSKEETSSLPHSMKTSVDEIIAQTQRPIAPPPNLPATLQGPRTAQPLPRPPTIVTPNTSNSNISSQTATQQGAGALKEISINFNNVAMIEYIRFISRISNKNFIFDDEDLRFNVTIVSEEPTTVENLMAALLQELRIRDLSLMEQGNNIIIHRNSRIRSPARIVADNTDLISSQESELVTRVFRLNTLDPVKASEIIRPLLSEDALIEILRDTNNLIVTDLVTNVNKIAQLIATLDAPNSGITIGQYVVRNAFVDSLVDLANKILSPIAQGNPFVLVPHPVSNSIFIVSNSFIVEKALAILQNLDLNEGHTKILSLETLQPTYLSPSARGANIPVRRGVDTGTRRSATIPQPNTGLEPIPPEGAVPQAGVPPIGGRQGEFGPENQVERFRPSDELLEPGSDRNYLEGQAPIPEGTPESYPLEGAPESYPLEGFPLGGISTGGRGASPSSSIFQPTPPPFGAGGIGTGGRPGRPSAIFDESRNFLPGGIGSTSRSSRDLPVGHIERTLFFIYKLRYRKGDNIEIALRKIANSLQLTGTANADLISAINSIQWIESSNALIFTGTTNALEKVKELILEVDVPLRQVFIEMLILDTTVADSLTYSVDWIDRFGGGGTTGEQGFTGLQIGTSGSTNSFITSAQSILPNNSTVSCPPVDACPLPVATGFLNNDGFIAGIIGTHLTHGGTRFSSIGALVRAIHTDIKAEIVLNPKIVTEDNNPAEIFVGGTDRYKTQSITNDLGSLVTNNFQFIDVGTTLRVTPLIGNNGIITLEIVQETTDESATANSSALSTNQDVNLVQVLTKTRTVTKVHVPNGFFVVLSGMIRDRQGREFTRIPCLGGIPIIGSLGKRQNTNDLKRNLMIFIRPLIIDSDEEFEDITRRQQDVYREKSKFRRSWNYEIDEALNFGEVKRTDSDERNCSERNQR